MQRLLRLSRSVGFIPKSPFPPAAASHSAAEGKPRRRSGKLPTIPGVGLRNSRKLVDKGIRDVADLEQLYRDKFYGASSKRMVEFLQNCVGITHKHHAESIAAFIKQSVDGDVKKTRLTFCVEGNIGAGKSTFLERIAKETLELRDLVQVVPEPIDLWWNIVTDYFNILDVFYADPHRYSHWYQNCVLAERLLQRVMQEEESSAGFKPLRLMEGSIYTERMGLIQAIHEAKYMNELELSMYDSWFHHIVKYFPTATPDAFIYLRATPDTCHKRMKLSVTEEGRASPELKYLRDLHEKHERWLFPSIKKPAHVDNSVHPNIRDRVFYMDSNLLPCGCYEVPTLVLDFEPNINFNRDIEAKREYGRQVAEFFEFVKKKKEAASNTNPVRL